LEEEERYLYYNSFGKRDRNWSRVLYRRLASYPTLGGGGKISILKLVWENEIVIGAGSSTGDWLRTRHLEGGGKISVLKLALGNEIVIFLTTSN
jgi:hypothetical protein